MGEFKGPPPYVGGYRLSRLQAECEISGLVVSNLPRAPCLAKLLRVTDSRSGARLCEPQHVRMFEAFPANPNALPPAGAAAGH